MIVPSSQVGSSTSVVAFTAPAAAASRWKRAVGVVYLMFTLSCMMRYVVVLAPSLTNDLYWPTYNRTGFAVFLVDVINAKLQTAPSTSAPFVVSMTGAISFKGYASDLIQAAFDSGSSRRILFTELNNVPRAVQSIRSTPAGSIVSIVANYCWLDLDRRWELAHTSGRAMRCAARYQDNAGVYMETFLRNTNWTGFLAAHGDPWTTTIAAALQKSTDGVEWLRLRPVVAQSLSVDDEVRFLEKYNLTRFDLQWHNNQRISISETIAFENAFMMQTQAMLVKASPSTRTRWTSLVLFPGVINDFLIYSSFNMSIVRSDPQHYDKLGLPFSALFGYSEDYVHYFDQPGLLYDNLGPLGSIDALFVPLPPPLSALYSAFDTVMQTAGVGILSDVVRFQLRPMPPNFSGDGLDFYGGNLLCLANSPTPYPQSMFAFHDECTQTLPLTIGASDRSIVFALAATGSSSINASTICYDDERMAGDAACMTSLHVAAKLVQTSRMFDDLSRLVAPAADIGANIQLSQYAKNASGAWLLLEQNLLVENDATWSFFGWLAIFDWMQNKREVVRLEGDLSTLTTMSEVNPTVLLPSSSIQNQGGESGPQSIYYLILYMTALSVGIGIVVWLYAVFDRTSRIDASSTSLLDDLFVFNRVACFVWVGRPLLLLRGVTAVLLLSSTTATLRQDVDGYSVLERSPRAIWDTLIVAGEFTWTTYVWSDILVIATKRDWINVVGRSSAFVAFVVALVLEYTSPISVTMSVHRECTAFYTDKGVDCTSGVVKSGDSVRFAVLVGTSVASVAVSLVAVALYNGITTPSTRPPTAPLVLHGAAEAFLHRQNAGDSPEHLKSYYLDNVACILTGLVPWTFRRVRYTFDVKRWLVLAHNSSETAAACSHEQRGVRFDHPTFGLTGAVGAPPTSPPPNTIILVARRVWKHHLSVFGVVITIIGTCISSISYIAVSTVNFGNDYYWATFNMTGHHVVIADWFNEQLVFQSSAAPSDAYRLDDPRWTAVAKNYSNPKVVVSAAFLYGTTVQATKLASVVNAVEGLRRSDPCGVPWISTQYCWVDFQRRWPMANSAARQRRCAADMANGAVYLESVLRNVDWGAWSQCWGDSFDIAIGRELSLSDEGKAWLRLVQTNKKSTSVHDEANEWTRAGIDKYVVQWQNYKRLGLINTYMIENAFGVQYPMTLSRANGSFYLAGQSTFKMYWALASDLWAVADNSTLIGGMSLVSTSANYAFANTSTSMFGVLVQNGTLESPLYNAFNTVEQVIGPFGSIDMKIVPCPAEVQTLVATGLSIIRTTVAGASSSASSDYSKLVIAEPMFVVPTIFQTPYPLRSYGGSILCPEIDGFNVTQGLGHLTQREFTCGPSIITKLYATRNTLLISAMATAGLVRQAPAALAHTIDRICRHDNSAGKRINKHVGAALAFLQTNVAEADVLLMEALAAAALSAVRQANVSIMQYMRRASRPPDRSLQLGRAMLLDPNDPTFELWSWGFATEWATASREVVSFQGDHGQINIITDLTGTVFSSIQAQEMPTTFAMYARSGLQYVTGVMLSVTFAFGIYIATSRGQVEASNVLRLNRVAGIVWVGRPLLFLRGLTALCLLSTATLELQSAGTSVVSFVVPAMPWYKTIISAGESTWLVYILNDLMMAWTKESTASYASMSSMLVWFVSAVLTLVQPVVHRATIDPVCQIDQVDFQLVCNSGVVAIGDVGRFYWLLQIIGICTFVCFVVSRMTRTTRWAPPRPTFVKTSFLLSAGAMYLFKQTLWTFDNVYYMDAASALLNGLITFRTTQFMYVLDIKLWRCFVLKRASAGTETVPSHLRLAIPLLE